MKKEDILKILEEADKVSSKLTDKQIEQYTFDKFTDKQKEQFIKFAKKGGSTNSENQYKHSSELGKVIGKIIGKKNVESGHLKSICSDGGKAGAKSQMEKKIGIHTADAELRRQWAILGGKKSVAALNQTRTCPHCGKTTAGGGYYRWHGDNCKNKI